MTFAHSQLLWLLLLLPPGLALFFWWSWRKRQQLLTQFIAARLLPGLTIGISARRQKIRLVCLVLGVACLIVALARPQWGFDWEEVKQRGLDIVVAIDTSKSMLAEDIAPNRLARAKLAALELMQRAKADRLGLVAFAGGAFLQCPLTIDDSAFQQSVEALDVNIIPQGGTALAEAIDTALTAYKEGENYKILVLFTDGEDQDSGALEAAEKASKAGLRIFTVGIGSAEGEMLRIKDAKGRSDYVRDEQGNVIKSHLNETLLQQIAGASAGFYLPLRGAKTIDELYQKGLAPLPKSESDEKLIRRYHERFHWPLGLAVLLLIAEMVLPERKRAVATKPAAVRTKGAVGQAAVVLLALLLPTWVFGSPQSAFRQYQAGKYQQALKEYQRLLENQAEDPRLHFNAGAAAYREQKLEEALKQFSAAISAPDLKLQEQAYYNRGNTLYWLGKSNSEPGKRQETWEQSLKDYQSTMKLNPQDADAKFNYDFVKKRLEELKQQQQQQQQSKDNKSDEDKNKDQDKQQQQNRDQQEQAKNDQNKDSQSQQNQQDQQKQDQQQKQQDQQSEQQKQEQAQKEKEQKEKEQQEKQQKQAQKEQQEKEQQQAKQSQANDKEGAGQTNNAAQAYAVGQMTPEQAQQLLDAQKGEEKLVPIRPVAKPVERKGPIRDW